MNWTFPVVAILALHLTGAHAAVESIDEHVSPNGTEFFLARVTGSDEVVIRVAWPTDWAVNADVNHTAPILAMRSQILGGAEGFDPGALKVLLNDAYAEVHLSPDSQFMYGVIAFWRDGAEDVLAAINAHLRTPRFDELWFRRVQDEYMNHLMENQNKSLAFAFDTTRWSTFGDHPHRRSQSFEGSLDAIREVKRSDLVSWAKATYTGAPQVLIVSGDIDAGKAGRFVDLLLRGLPGDPNPTVALPIGKHNAGRVLIHVPHARDSYVAISGAVSVSAEWPKIHDGFIVRTLAHSGSGLLHDAVRDSLRAAYSVTAEVGEFHYESHFLLIHGSVETSAVNDYVEAILQTYGGYVESPSVEGLDRFLSWTEESLEHDANDPGAVSHAALRAVLRGHDVSAVLERIARVKRFSDDMVRERVRNGYPHADELLIVVASPDADALSDACVIEAPEDVLGCR